MAARDHMARNNSHNVYSRYIGSFFLIFAFLEFSRNLLQMKHVSFDDYDLYRFDQPSVSYPINSHTNHTHTHTRTRTRTQTENTKPKTTVAFAVSVTHYNKHNKNENGYYHMDRAAVLHQSIKVAMQKSLRYDYHIYAFVHPDAVDAKPWLERLGYRVQIRDTPFNISEIPNPALIQAQSNGCCKEKEYLKLYSYLLSDYPVAVHMDLDAIVLRPMDDLFDVMTMTTNENTNTMTNASRERAARSSSSSSSSFARHNHQVLESFARTSTMWINNSQNNINSTHASNTILDDPAKINFMFTRDYNMVDPSDPPYKHPYQIGVQGGFLVIRPNQRDFDRMLEIILTGGKGYTIGSGWGGSKLGYGGYYGAATIQGLASFYYDHHEKATRSVELNRCKYNTMVDDPHDFDEDINRTLCRTTEGDGECEDCRETKLKEVYTAHFTVCGKPEWCEILHQQKQRLCWQLMRKWHKIRLSLELEWMNRFSSIDDEDEHGESTTSLYIPKFSKQKEKLRFTMGHCELSAEFSEWSRARREEQPVWP